VKSLLLFIWVLPRWFAAPVIIASVFLGYIVSTKDYSQSSLIAVVFLSLSALFMMAFGHTMNTILDYHWTGLDKGKKHSRKKPYTSGQQVIFENEESGTKTSIKAAITYALISLAFILVANTGFNIPAWVFAPWFAGLLIPFWYSWGKLHYQCELALGIGFAPLAALIGSSAALDPDFVRVVLSSLPILLIFGFVAETYDQWYDADVNEDRLKNIGAVVYRRGYNISFVILFLIILTAIAQGALIERDVLSSFTGLAAVPVLLTLPFLYSVNHKNSIAILSLLLSMSLYVVLLPILEGVS